MTDDQLTPETKKAASGTAAPRGAPKRLARRFVGAARDVASDVVGEAAELGDAAAERIRTTRQRMQRHESPGARTRRLRRLNRVPLANLFELHPEGRRASRRELGVLTVPVSRIRGTAVEGPAQRGGDFLPFPALKSPNWQNRWQRIRDALDRLEILPPVDLIQTSDGYWVTDGHNRVAAALYGGQDDIDASVTHLHLPNTPDEDVQTGTLAGVLEDSMQLRAAGAGRLSRGATARGAAASGPAATGRKRSRVRSPAPGTDEPGGGGPGSGAAGNGAPDKGDPASE